MKKNVLKSVSILSLTTILLMQSSCATIFGRSSYDVTFNSNPTAAKITIIDKRGLEIYTGSTPATVKLKSSSGYFSKGQYQIKLQLPDHEDKTFTVDGKLNGWYFGNLLLGGLIGMLIVDPASGAMYKIKDTTYTENLQGKSSAQIESLQIIDINTLPSSVAKNLQKLN